MMMVATQVSVLLYLSLGFIQHGGSDRLFCCVHVAKFVCVEEKLKNGVSQDCR